MRGASGRSDPDDGLGGIVDVMSLIQRAVCTGGSPGREDAGRASPTAETCRAIWAPAIGRNLFSAFRHSPEPDRGKILGGRGT